MFLCQAVHEKLIQISFDVSHVQIRRWLRYFDLDDILILDGDNMISKPWDEVIKVQEFLGIRVS